jgi:hypothetical protein
MTLRICFVALAALLSSCQGSFSRVHEEDLVEALTLPELYDRQSGLNGEEVTVRGYAAFVPDEFGGTYLLMSHQAEKQIDGQTIIYCGSDDNSGLSFGLRSSSRDVENALMVFGADYSAPTLAVVTGIFQIGGASVPGFGGPPPFYARLEDARVVQVTDRYCSARPIIR